MQDLYRACMAYLKLARTHSADPAIMDQGRRAGQELMEYLRTLRADKVILPGGDLVSQLAPTDCDVDALLCMCGVVLLAGVETTVRGLANTVYALLTGPRQVVDALQSGEFSGVQAFEEGLRWIAPLSLKARQVALPTVIHGVELAVGDQVFVSIGAANRDPRHYSDPDEFQIGRRNMDHLAFGSARHYCIGAPLARIEGGTVIDVLLDRCAGLRLAQDQKVQFEGGPVYRSPRELWLEVGS
jgi:cytochrome P450